MSAFPFLEKALERLRPFLADDRVSEISVNRPGELFIERLGVSSMERVEDTQFTSEWIRTLSERVAGSTNQVVNDEHPILSASLPSGERFQCVLPPAAPAGGAISIRKQVIHDIGLDVYQQRGAFEQTRVGRQLSLSAAEEQLAAMMQGDVDAMEFLRTAVRLRVSIVVSGGTSTGKTTFLNALLKEIPEEERIVTIEDTRELKPITPNTVALLASKGDQGRAKVTQQQLLEASLRMRPDRLMLGELRGAEAFSFLQAINTGHPGSLTTVHANSGRSAYERLALMVMQSGMDLKKQEIIDYLKEVIPIVVQLARMPDGRRVVSEIVFTKADAS
ncbi:P-type DNA transfer ATPase VirB11 (plasmid) [Sinorhizobium medicae]|uniref:P-type DNA transfer ATPase VirB11 n=1 Tax=Sinorhizobium medicae TaxID=110321 RepID=UPI002AF6C447|nr:P-type DNA transfer ATPase VirB11 [Sinorhizobium medicae]WQO48383.1 P-type DNA transfer ATPase VirB11 [Sinorhizobium medicae]WQO68797.1 P-type DNA transfer ATPase VirB11 [Sinorhizobium medicae]WQO75836.1 P-type DNA transfer ATPase VirB11 [Sinorhizobium medicae]WQO94994.1 P-type DNA transfer ATPase VirB11 [Sinorhizobium medicae]